MLLLCLHLEPHLFEEGSNDMMGFLLGLASQSLSLLSGPQYALGTQRRGWGANKPF